MDSSFPLLEALRHRREFTLEEVLLLAKRLPAMLDRLETPFMEGKLLPQLWVATYHGNQGTMTHQSVLQWPAFALQLRRPTTHQAEESAPDVTVVARVDQDLRPPLFRLAELLYELLGGRQGADRADFRPPLAALNAESNAQLLAAFNTRARIHHPVADALGPCETFWRQWTSSCGIENVIPVIPQALLSMGQAGQALYLRPQQHEIPTRVLIARPQFRLGRSSKEADWITRFLPANPENDSRNRKLSRIHVLAERIDSGWTIRDGDGEDPSANGSFWNEKRLTTQPRAITQPGKLRLGSQYFLEVVPVWSEHTQPLQISNFAVWKKSVYGHPQSTESIAAAEIKAAPPEPDPEPEPEPPIGPYQAVVFRPPSDQPAYRDTLWLLTRIGFDLNVNGELVWHLGQSESPGACFLHYQGSFWILNETGRISLTVDGYPLRPNEIAPLASGQHWKIGPLGYILEID